MDPNTQKYGLHYYEDPNCNIHFMDSALPEELPTLNEIQHKFFGINSRVVQWNENYMIKRKCTAMEGWTMVYLRETTSIPIPRVYALLTDKTAKIGKKRDIIIMEYISNESLQETWPTLKSEEKEDVANQLTGYFAELRALPHPKFFGRWVPPQFGGLAKQPLTDPLFGDTGGLFETIEDFTKGIRIAIENNSTIPVERRKLYSRMVPDILSDSLKVPVFTHGDIQARNLIRKNDGQVVIIDWEDCGWYPEWWECCNATFAASGMIKRKTDWPSYIPKFLSEDPPKLCLFLLLRDAWISGKY